MRAASFHIAHDDILLALPLPEPQALLHAERARHFQHLVNTFSTWLKLPFLKERPSWWKPSQEYHESAQLAYPDDATTHLCLLRVRSFSTRKAWGFYLPIKNIGARPCVAVLHSAHSVPCAAKKIRTALPLSLACDTAARVAWCHARVWNQRLQGEANPVGSDRDCHPHEPWHYTDAVGQLEPSPAFSIPHRLPPPF